MKALGMIEVYGLLTAIEALDAALKAANVQLLSVTKVTGGLVCVQITGDVGATKAAIDASAAAAAKVGKVISVHVIPRPAQSVEAMLNSRSLAADDVSATTEHPGPGEEEPATTDFSDPGEEEPAEPSLPEQVDDLTALTVVELRAMARDIGVSSMSKHDIRFAKKGELLTAIRNFREQGR